MSDITSTISQKAAKMFQDAATILETGTSVSRTRVAVTGLGSELGESVVAEACAAAAAKGYAVYYLGTVNVPGAVSIVCADEEACAAEMARLLKSGECDAAVTMHHLFSIGTATVGRVVTPSRGKEMFISTTTGTPSTDRTESLVLGALYGIITAKACGIVHPTVGILNIDGARRAETALNKLIQRGFPMELAESARADGGAVLRGNDILLGTSDVLVCDPLTGNVLMKMLSAFTTGGNRECSGYGYGPCVGRGEKNPIMIVSRASDTPVIFNAILYAAEVHEGRIVKITEEVLSLADKCGLREILAVPKQADSETGGEEVKPPGREPVTEEISGIEVTDIEDAARLLWKNGVYAESGMGCTGPVVMVSEKNHTRAVELLRTAQYVE